ncbi:MAG TPA: ATP-grasp domain-containing protein [Bacteroidota bacterium]|nr:ATP-grasp domain-containing protein [Bacteroidota bacterium]
MSDPLRVLITGGGTATAVSVLKGLRVQREVPVHVTLADAQETIAGRYLADAFIQIPPANSPAFLDALRTVCRKHSISLLIPIVDYEFEIFSKNAREFLDDGTRVVISPLSVIQTCGDKQVLAAWLASRGLPAPMIVQKDEALAGRATFPLFVKPRKGGRGSLGAQRVDSAEELEVACSKLDEPLIQEFIDGEEYTVDTLSDFDGRLLGAVPRLRIETKSGVSVKGKTVRMPELVELVKNVAEALPILGPSNIQCFRRRDGSFVVSEVNPRFAAAVVLSIAAGFNSPMLLLKLARGEKIEPFSISVRYGMTMLRYWEEVFVQDDGTAVTDFWRLGLPR